MIVKGFKLLNLSQRKKIYFYKLIIFLNNNYFFLKYMYDVISYCNEKKNGASFIMIIFHN